jgi:hypothetical protein
VISTACQTQNVSGSTFTKKESGSSAKDTKGAKPRTSMVIQANNFL